MKPEPRAWFLTNLKQASLRVGLFILPNETFHCGFSKKITSWTKCKPTFLWQNLIPQSQLMTIKIFAIWREHISYTMGMGTRAHSIIIT